MVGASGEVWLAVFERGHAKLKSFQRLHLSRPLWLLLRVEGKLVTPSSKALAVRIGDQLRPASSPGA